MGEKLELFFSAWELFREPTLAGAIAGATLGLLGVWIVLRGMVFLSATLSQVAGFGVAVALVAAGAIGATLPGLGAALFTVCAALALTLRARGSADPTLGLLFLAASAGTLLLAGWSGTELHDIDTLLFGSAVAVLPSQFRWLAGVCAIVFALHLWWWRGFAAVTIDRDDAAVRRLPTDLLEGALVTSAALVVAVSTWVLGALPTFAFSVLPALAALALAPNVRVALALGAAFGLLAGGGGYVLAFLLDAPVGPAQTGLGVALALGARVARP